MTARRPSVAHVEPRPVCQIYDHVEQERRGNKPRCTSAAIERDSTAMRFALYGLVIAALVFLASGGHVLFLPLFVLLPLGGLFGHRRRDRRL